MKTAYKIRYFYIVAVISILIFATITIDSYEFHGEFHYHYLWFVVLAQVLEWILLSIAWQQTILRLSNKSQNLTDCFAQLTMVMVGKYIPGKVWGMLARGMHLKTTGLDYAESLVATYVEQILFVHTGITLGSLAWYLATGSGLWALLGIVSMLGILLVPALNTWLFSTGNRIIRHWLADKVRLPDTPPTLNMSDYVRLYLLYTLHWLADLAIPSAVFLIVSPQWPTTDLLLLLGGANAFGIIVGFFAFFAPGGIGVREGVIVGLMLAYMPLQDAMLFVLAYRLWLVIADLFSLGVVFVIRRLGSTAH
ncbi:MAG: flippase-like domain-containing protein [Gammaproteobacteria bacterium]|nr:flippase-like domain-containing protein [Gammaproteobacteria bacterium]